MRHRLIGKGTTDENGIAHMTKKTSDGGATWSDATGYVGVGAGLVDVVASVDKPIASGSVVSEPHTVMDYIGYDEGTINNHNDLFNVMTGFTRGNGYTTVDISASENTQQGSTDTINVGGGVRCELDLLSVDTSATGSESPRFQIARYQDGESTTYNNRPYGDARKVVIDVTPTSTVFKIDEHPVNVLINTTNNTFKLFYLVSANKSQFWTYKDLKIYPLDIYKDYLFADVGISGYDHNNYWYNYTTASEVTATGTKVTNNINLYLRKTTTGTSTYVWDMPLGIEFDITDLSTSGAAFQLNDGTSVCNYRIVNGHWKVSINSNGVPTVTVDGETISQINGATNTLSTTFRIGFHPQVSSFKFKNFEVYSI